MRQLLGARAVRWLLWLTYVTALTVALLVPNPVKVKPDEEVKRLATFLFSKTVHITSYGLMTLLAALLPVAPRRRWLLYAFMSAHAALSEYLQYAMDIGRTGSWRDVAFDNLGIALGGLCVWYLRPWLARFMPARDTAPAAAAATTPNPRRSETETG